MTQRLQTTRRAVIAPTILLALGVFAGSAGNAVADKTKAELEAEAAAHRARGACQGAYPGWLRGVVDGYNGTAASPVENKTLIKLSIPTPEVLKPGDERLGWGDGLEEGHRLGVEYGVELGKAARTPESNTAKMDDATTKLGNYIKLHCGGLIAPLDWDAIAMDDRGTTTITSLNEAQLTMSLAASANQIAIGTENLARCAREAEAKGDQVAAAKCRAEAKASAHIAIGFADMAKSHEAAGRAEAAIAVRDAKDAADKAKKAADDAGG